MPYRYPYDPNQPRVPAGEYDGGEWTPEGYPPVRPVLFDPRRYAAQKTLEAIFALFTWLSLRNGRDQQSIIVFKARDYHWLGQPYGTKGSVRVDVLEKRDEATVCVYDIKTGQSGLSPARFAEIASSVCFWSGATHHHHRGEADSMTTAVQVKRVTRPLLERNGDLALVGRVVVIKPVRHLLRGVSFDRGVDPIVFRPTWFVNFLFKPGATANDRWGERLYREKRPPRDFDDPIEQDAMHIMMDQMMLRDPRASLPGKLARMGGLRPGPRNRDVRSDRAGSTANAARHSIDR